MKQIAFDTYNKILISDTYKKSENKSSILIVDNKYSLIMELKRDTQK
jgi:hypothetical protein